MSHERTYSGILGTWQRLLAALLGLPELAHLEAIRAKLAMIADRVIETSRQQADLAANKQELSRSLRADIDNGERLATMLRKGVREHYGPRAEKLTAFGLLPFRGRKSSAPVVDPPAPETAAPAGDPQSDR